MVMDGGDGLTNGAANGLGLGSGTPPSSMPSISSTPSMNPATIGVNPGNGHFSHGPVPTALKTFSAPSGSCLTSEIMQKFLESNGANNMSITIRHAKVVQKSYGTEKRFFCPPPIVRLSGMGWQRKDKSGQRTNENLQELLVWIFIGAPQDRALEVQGVNTALAAEPFQKPGNPLGMPQGMHPGMPPPGMAGMNPFDPMAAMMHQHMNPHALWRGGLGGPHGFGLHPHNSHMGGNNTNTAAYEPQQLNFNGCDYCTAKQLFINDSDKRKHFELHVKCFFNQNTDLGQFTSRRIKVISKPSKKKQTVKNNDLSIQSGSKIALYNRLRSQTVSTRYLNVEGGEFKASSTEWGSFTIYLLNNPDEDDLDPEGFEARVGDEYIKYGDTIKLIHNDTQIALPKMVVRRVEKTYALRNATDPVSQMHKCAFKFPNGGAADPQQMLYAMYMGLNQDCITQLSSTPNQENDNITEGAIWTIVSIDSVKYTFNDSFAKNKGPVNPVPIVRNVKNSGNLQQGTAMIELEGENFSSQLQVWFDNVPAQTMYRCREILMCNVPHVSTLRNDWDHVKHEFKVSLTLARKDGVIYPTSQKYKYEALHPVQSTRILQPIVPNQNAVLPKIENSYNGYDGYAGMNGGDQPDVKRSRLM